MQQDTINKPDHYHRGLIDPIGYAKLAFPPNENKGFYRINVIKYVSRYDKKNGIEDLEKAKYYIDMLIGLEKKHER